MFGFLKRDKGKKRPQLTDMDNNPLGDGDIVLSQRYELGKCRLILTDDDFIYESLENGKKVSWIKMIDATTERQKVKRIQVSV